MKIGAIITIIILIVLVGLIWAFFLKPINEQVTTIKKACEDNNLSPCHAESLICFSNCRDLGQEYFKYDDGGFASDECWCKVNNKTEQIW